METNDDDDDEEDEDEDEDEDENDEEENLTVTMPNSFPLPSPPLHESNMKFDHHDKILEMNNSSSILLERLEKIVPKNILEVLKTVEVNPNELHPDMNTTGLFIDFFIFSIEFFLV